eukprot:TRINITY_DN9075_c0_g1_i1.p2 TRINITY_DN9075_c0_g1~~TRINITY_DN9075_c0_g1_i1.p2  ORF type:complete len:143 (+),score=42.80 TRINITY_DN9075_c0_g1_i1:1006-1434(+)
MSMVKYLLKEGLYEVILMNDQLLQAMKEGRVMEGLEEGKIQFAPTYRYVPDTDEFSKKEGRIASYTDRILFKAREENFLRLMSYDSNTEIKISDHRPVFAQFLCKFESREPEGDVTREEALDKIKRNESMFGKARSAACCMF